MFAVVVISYLGDAFLVSIIFLNIREFWQLLFMASLKLLFLRDHLIFIKCLRASVFDILN